ncbi:CsbD family protein [Guyparkeria halophila]|uniref:CsbD family protein n=1 Tax=Guyparkeria halophila TaxID=47960 RepID=A0ABZ0YWD1_9GAMM|nr:CsbD family protein [Guyparkeria halophila]WQH15694.1 CsbD family protein [Guyparkeria halophila]
MDAEQIKANWNKVKGDIKKQWGKLTDDDLAEAEGHRDYLIGKIQERYGIAKDEARRQLDEFEKKL